MVSSNLACYISTSKSLASPVSFLPCALTVREAEIIHRNSCSNQRPKLFIRPLVDLKAVSFLRYVWSFISTTKCIDLFFQVGSFMCPIKSAYVTLLVAGSLLQGVLKEIHWWRQKQSILQDLVKSIGQNGI